MHIEIKRKNPSVVLLLDGRLSMGEASVSFRRTVRELLNDGYKRFVFNLEGVDYADSSGIGELINCHALITSQDGAVRCVLAGGKVKNLLQVTKLVTVFEVMPDEASALESLQRWSPGRP